MGKEKEENKKIRNKIDRMKSSTGAFVDFLESLFPPADEDSLMRCMSFENNGHKIVLSWESRERKAIN